MNTVPAASIIVPSYRGVTRLPALFDSLAAQQEGTPAFEVIVVIDGIDDGSVALCTQENRIDVRHILFPENRGRVAALNAGFEAARGNVLIRCDDDLLPSPQYVAGHVRAHAEENVGVVGLYLNRYEDTRYAEVYGKDSDSHFRAGAYAAEESMRWRYWAGNCSITRAQWDSVGPYDPRYRLYGWEDVDYGYRMAAAGHRIILASELETVHRVAAVTTEKRAQRAAHAAAARRLFEAKHPDHSLPPAEPSLSVWNALVILASRSLARNPRRFGRFVDAVIPRLPKKIATKLVALAVESSALAGFRDQKLAKEVF